MIAQFAAQFAAQLAVGNVSAMLEAETRMLRSIPYEKHERARILLAKYVRLHRVEQSVWASVRPEVAERAAGVDPYDQATDQQVTEWRRRLAAARKDVDVTGRMLEELAGPGQ